jgi:hypothetical protein
VNEPKKFAPRSGPVEAIQFTGTPENITACAKFMGLREEFNDKAKYDSVGNDGNLYPSKKMRSEFLCMPYRYAGEAQPRSAMKGDWIVKLPDGFHALRDAEFRERFVTEEP